MVQFRSFSWKDTNVKVCCDEFDLVVDEIVSQRRLLEAYIKTHPEFQTSFEPISLHANAPLVAKRMAEAAWETGLGPMAAVAGTLAQLGVERALEKGCKEGIVENGGDMYLVSSSPILIGLYAGDNELGSNLAFRIEPENSPLAICSSSSHMGHSISLGNCELATVVASNAALADATATMVCNRIQGARDIQGALNAGCAIEGVGGILAIAEGKVGICGNLPALVRNEDPDTVRKITRDQLS